MSVKRRERNLKVVMHQHKRVAVQAITPPKAALQDTSAWVQSEAKPRTLPYRQTAEDVVGYGGLEDTSCHISIFRLFARNAPLGTKRASWNKGRVIGQKHPLLPKHIWAIRVRLELAGMLRDLALFNMAIDSKLRGCDLVRLRVADVFAAGHVKERASVLQSKTKQPVRFEITEGTRASLRSWIDVLEHRRAEFLWPGRRLDRSHIGTRQYARLVHEWVASIGLEPSA